MYERLGRDGARVALAMEGDEGASGEADAAVRQLEELRAQGMLLGDVPDPSAVRCAGADLRGLRAICLNVAHRCNMSCAYCFAAEGSYGAKQGLMSEQVARDAIDFLFAGAVPGARLEIDFFGGEPLLNMVAIRAAVDRVAVLTPGSGHEVRFTVTTNALLLDGTVADFVDSVMHNVVLSLDGRPEVHDRLRRVNGQGSHHAVSTRALEFAARRRPRLYWVRGTYTRHNLDFLDDVQYLADMGFDNISLEPVVGSPDAPHSLRHADFERIDAEYGRLADWLAEVNGAGRNVRFFHFELAAGGGSCWERRAQGCGAGVDYMAVTPDGTLYPCHQFVNVPGFALGDVRNGCDNGRQSPFRSLDIYEKRGCADCWARFMCGGGCHAAAYFAGKDLKTPDEIACRLHRSRLEWAYYLADVMSGSSSTHSL